MERSQPLSLRGLYNQPISFYFETLTGEYEDAGCLWRSGSFAWRTKHRDQDHDAEPGGQRQGAAATFGISRGAPVASYVLHRVDNRDPSTRARRGSVSAAPAGRQQNDRRRGGVRRPGSLVQDSRPSDSVGHCDGQRPGAPLRAESTRRVAATSDSRDTRQRVKRRAQAGQHAAHGAARSRELTRRAGGARRGRPARRAGASHVDCVFWRTQDGWGCRPTGPATRSTLCPVG